MVRGPRLDETVMLWSRRVVFAQCAVEISPVESDTVEADGAVRDPFHRRHQK